MLSTMPTIPKAMAIIKYAFRNPLFFIPRRKCFLYIIFSLQGRMEEKPPKVFKTPRCFLPLRACSLAWITSKILAVASEDGGLRRVTERFPRPRTRKPRFKCNINCVKVRAGSYLSKKVIPMTETKNILVNQSVAILCDGNNIERSIHEQSRSTNTMVNFDKLIPKLLNGRGLNRLIYFREGQNISSKLAERLHQHYYGSVVPCHKSADIPLSIKATQLAPKVDTIIIMSGDSDYIDLVKHLKSEGVRVEIAAVPETTSKQLIEDADYFHAITKDDWFMYTPTKRR